MNKDNRKIKITRPEGCTLRNDFDKVFLNRHGYYELKEKNTQQERKQNFEEHYFQEYKGATYEKQYPADELAFIINKIEERAYVIEHNLQIQKGQSKTGYTLLDIGCGEGFLLQYFHDRGVKVKGIDCGSYALEHFHPDMLQYFEKGDMETLLPRIAERGEKYDVVNMDRVLDMVQDADECLDMAAAVMDEHSILIIKVANNYSYLQQMLLQTGELQTDYWLDAPDHTAYFNREGMVHLLEAHGFTCMDFYGDTFVDFQLLNPQTNYYERPETGKMAHRTAVRLENLFHETSMERTVEIYRLLGEMGFGREIVGVFRKNNNIGI